MMTLDEAIKHCEEVVESKRKQVENGNWEKGSLTERDCLECADEHKQLAKWLRDYKRLLEREPTFDKIIAEIEQIKSIMNEEIINNNRKDLINFVNGLNQSLVIVDKYKAEREE